MGPLRGFRVINLRVPGKVAYPDLTVALERHEHTVIGLENGGGKSTLLGFLIHVFLPNAKLFLPRLAHRRQHKKGEEKRIEHYVPGGLPTHVIVEIELPPGRSARPASNRALVGACLYKDHDTGPSVPAKEFFWSARCVTDELELAALGVRSADGELLDRQEWRSWLDAMRRRCPAAEITFFEDQNSWDGHLRKALRVDVEFIKSWLLSMNQDEGAADHVFTYASARSFLNSLVDAVAPPELIEDIKKSLVAMAEDADHMRIDRRREILMRRLVQQTGPLADLIDELNDLVAVRTTLADALLAAGRRLAEGREQHQRALDVATEAVDTAMSSAREANNAYSDALALEVLGRAQLARVQLADVQTTLAARQTDQQREQRLERTAKASVLLTRIRAVTARMAGLADALAELAEHAEPTRRATASAVQAWLARIDAEVSSLNVVRDDHQKAENEAVRRGQRARARLLTAEGMLGRLTARHEAVSDQLAGLDTALETARRRGDLGSDEDADVARAAAAALDEALAAIESSAGAVEALDADLAEVGAERLRLVGEGARAEGELAAAQSRCDAIDQATEELAAALNRCGLVDLSPIHLDDHVDIVLDRLAQVREVAHAQLLDAAVGAARARQAVQTIKDVGLLPPRPDVAGLCKTASEQAKLGARPGWTYLANVNADVATRLATEHPLLADGIVVNVPEDFDKVVALVQTNQQSLDGPIGIGLVEAFDRPATIDSITVVLPDHGLWSEDAAAQQLGDRQDRDAQQQELVRDLSERHDVAIHLSDRVREWRDRIGPGRLATVQHEVETVAAQVQQIADADGVAGSHEDELRRRRPDMITAVDTARSLAKDCDARLGRLDTLVERLAARPELIAELGQLDQDIATHTGVRTAAEAGTQQAETDRQTATAGRHDVAERLGALTPLHAEATAMAGGLVQPDDATSEDDAQADRIVLSNRARTLFDRWRGLLSDPELTADLKRLREHAAELDAEKTTHEDDVLAAATALLDANPMRTERDYLDERDRARAAQLHIAGEIGRLTQEATDRENKLTEIETEYTTLRRPRALSSTQMAIDVDTAARVAAALRAERDAALATRQHADAELAAAEGTRNTAQARLELTAETGRRLESLLVPLTSAGTLVQEIDATDRVFALDITAVLDNAPAPLADLLSTCMGSQEPVDAARARINNAVDAVTDESDLVRRKLGQVERAANQRLEAVEAVLLDTDDELRTGDQLIQTMRALTRTERLARARQDHESASVRLAAIAHYVATFDARIDNLGQTTFASVQHLIRAVQQTVRDSRLPTTSAMGRWSGLSLLRLTNLDGLRVDQRLDAIQSVLRDWFAPDRVARRPAFDADETVWSLVAAVTPRFGAKVLIPSDPLDPEHKPVERLSVETSGGEGVTFALILASLLAARRASAHGHQRTTLPLDNPLAKVTKPTFLRLARDVASSLGVQIVALTGIRDMSALTVFPALVQLRISHRDTANFVVPEGVDDARLQVLLHAGTLFASPVERQAAVSEDAGAEDAWPVVSAARVQRTEHLELEIEGTGDDA